MTRAPLPPSLMAAVAWACSLVGLCQEGDAAAAHNALVNAPGTVGAEGASRRGALDVEVRLKRDGRRGNAGMRADAHSRAQPWSRSTARRR